MNTTKINFFIIIKKQCEHNNLIIFFIFLFLHKKNSAKPKVTMHYSCGAKKYGFGSTNVAIF